MKRGDLNVAVDDFPGQLTARGLTSSPKERLAAALVEIERLRQIVEKPAATDIDSWGHYASQDVRDQMAASALIAAQLNPLRALNRLGFTYEDGESKKPWREKAKAIFDTPGVRALLAGDAAKFTGKKDAVLARLYQIAIHGEPDLAVRASGQLAKMIQGWQDGEKDKNPPINILMGLVHGQPMAAIGNGVAKEVAPLALPGSGEIIDAEAFFVETEDTPVAVVDEAR